MQRKFRTMRVNSGTRGEAIRVIQRLITSDDAHAHREPQIVIRGGRSTWSSSCERQPLRARHVASVAEVCFQLRQGMSKLTATPIPQQRRG